MFNVKMVDKAGMVVDTFYMVLLVELADLVEIANSQSLMIVLY